MSLDSGPDSTPANGCTPWPKGFEFSKPAPVAELNSAATEQSLSLTLDGRTAYFSSGRTGGSGGSDVYVATRPGSSGPFTSVTAYKSINSADEESQLSLSSDALIAVLSTTRAGGPGKSDLWVATRASVAQPFTSAIFFPAALLNTTENEWDPFLTSDGLTLYYQSTGDPKGKGGGELLVSQRLNVQSPFKQGTLLAAVNSADSDGNPAASSDGLVLVFSSTRPGGKGKSDIYYATRSSSAGTFGNPQLFPDVNTAANERDPFLTADGCTLYFASDRAGGKGELDFYRASFKKP
jgi:Tol biopolymer transport system component